MSHQLLGLFDDPRVHVLTSTVNDEALAALSKREAAEVSNAVAKRRREFATGRALVREALERFYGVRGFDLLNAQDRSPVWPQGIQGSISHSDTRAWAALVDADFGTIGIDGEARDELKRELWPFTMLDEEMAYLETLAASERGRRALTLFSAKEALYKAQYPRSGSFMPYKALRVELSEAGGLSCTFQETVGPFSEGFVARGRWLDENGLVTAVWISPT